ncbi:MAG: tetratricopeptide repeat protein [Bacteroidia bacterium]
MRFRVLYIAFALSTNSLYLLANDTLRIDSILEIANDLRANNIDSARLMANYALEQANNANYVRGKGYALKSLGILDYIAGDYINALSQWELAIKNFKASNDKEGIANMEMNIGSIYYNMGLQDLALNRYLVALKIAEEAKSEFRKASVLMNIGNIYSEDSNYYDSAKVFYLKAYESFLKLEKVNEEIATTIINLGKICYELKEYPKALKYYELIDTFKKRVDTKADYHASLGEVYLAMGKHEKGEEELGIALQLVKVSQVPFQQIDILFILIDIESKRKNTDLVYKYNHQIRKISRKLNLKIKLLEAYKNLSELNNKAENYDSAFHYLTQYNLLKDSLNNEKLQEDLNRQFFSFQDSLRIDERLKHEQALVAKAIKNSKRKNRIQYSAVIIIVLLLATTLAIFTKFKISHRLASGLIFIFFILTFEFLLVVLDPWVDGVSNGEVGWKIAINTAIALALFGIHQVSEKKLKTVILKADK